MKKIALTLVSILLATAAVTACGSGSADKKVAESSAPKVQEPVTIKYYNNDTEAEAAVTKKLIEGFQAKFPNIKVESISLVPGNSVETLKKLDVTLASGEQVDVAIFPNIEEIMARSAMGVLTPLDEFYTKAKVNPEEEYYVNPKYKGKYYGMMNATTNWLVAINEQALKESGLPLPSFDWTWDDFREYAKKLSKGDGPNKRYGAYFHNWGEYANTIAYTDKKSPYLTEDLKPAFNDPSFKQFFELRRAMEKDDKSVRPFADVIGAKLNYRTEFVTEKTAMLLTGSFLIANVADGKTYPHNFKTVFAPVPRSSKNAPEGLTNIGGTYFGIAANSKYKEQTFEFIRYMSTDSSVRTNLSGWKKVDSGALLERLYGNNKELVDLSSLKSTLYDKRVKTSVSTDIAVPYASQLKKVMEDGFSKFILDNTTAEDAQKSMTEQADKIIKQNTK
ncbi:ABC transporter substrate-binding protein [Paenibacillus roseipurpureus]|uniref:Extracellular solute-binding protein n=1 Tax=Paenibacillus roseopurpureus TaxID=2918901 RepID=A0AA96LQD7_9BACL|nr:extracellular solute-binding protein [Paenibacillus sp. MBLB1832]WNR46080.1 extracellular solute-binding protein [Paenibacillus sp. MBLB1832]